MHVPCGLVFGSQIHALHWQFEARRKSDLKRDIFWTKNMQYPLVMSKYVKIAIENGHRNSGFTH